MVGIRVTVSLRFRVRMTLTDSSLGTYRSKFVWLGFWCISVGIRNDGAVAYS